MDDNDEEIVKLPGFWEVLHKVAIALSIPVFLLGVSWAVWLTTTVWSHTTDIRVLQVQLLMQVQAHSQAQAEKVRREGPPIAALKEVR